MLRTLFKTKQLIKTNQNFFATIQFKLPDLGEKIKEAQVKKWLVKEGDQIGEYEEIADVATDKLFTQLYAPETGIITKIYIPEDEFCQVGQILCDIETESEQKISTPKQKPVINEEKKITKKTLQEINIKEEILASPAVRYFAKERNVELKNILPSGKNNRILKEDILNYVKQKDKQENSKIKPIQDSSIEQRKKQNIQEKEMNLFEQGMVKSMNYSSTIPHFNLHEEYNISQLKQIREQYNKITNQKISIFAYLVKCFSLCLNEHPKMNSNYYPEKEEYKYYTNSSHNISIAINSKNGLVAPNIKDVQNKSVKQINDDIKKLMTLSNEGKLTQEYLTGGTCALSNVGSISGYFAAPINLPNQVCIVALGKVFKKPQWDQKLESFIPIDVLPVSFGCDHRVLDGGFVANFSLTWRKYIENPEYMFSELKQFNIYSIFSIQKFNLLKKLINQTFLFIEILFQFFFQQ